MIDAGDVEDVMLRAASTWSSAAATTSVPLVLGGAAEGGLRLSIGSTAGTIGLPRTKLLMSVFRACSRLARDESDMVADAADLSPMLHDVVLVEGLDLSRVGVDAPDEAGEGPMDRLFAPAVKMLFHQSSARSRSLPIPERVFFCVIARGFLRPLPAFPSRGTPTPSHPCDTKKEVVLSGMALDRTSVNAGDANGDTERMINERWASAVSAFVLPCHTTKKFTLATHRHEI